MSQCLSNRYLHITGVKFDIVWRLNRRLPRNPTSAGPLTDLPDYTFMDGRPAPLGVCSLQIKREFYIFYAVYTILIYFL